MRLQRNTFTALLMLALITIPGTANAQQSFIIQGGVSGNLPMGDFASTNGVDAGYATFGVGFNIRVMFMPASNIALFAEFDLPSFGADEDALYDDMGSNLNEDIKYNLSMIGAGARLFLGEAQENSPQPYGQLGLGLYKSEMEMMGISVKSDRSLGFNFSGGAMIPLGTVMLDLSARFHSFKVKMDDETADSATTWLGFSGAISIPIGG